ncbi:hypothetical protein HYPBUDRAFT_8394 [Hyphopichia burtonii NRRL Y-1933]|uniref:Uncharacterized protein n=1 Tax=Hyphopichia burtonii NRRL Y-1933 TaxID=984485 RepID=A0A1E4RCI4_9ASCO|nr:hypothetical protein HYPBUDRAFT_8394 [Hyphopichia burtonii NRRL Y-1933]ODV64933.1 hypothetical protein HYPBUDRAFT_8394 [Hyphopichia burtonii NRRL Y-1933]
MSLVSHLTSDLTNLASESKRKSPETRHACDKALSDLKAYLPSIHINDILDNQIKIDLVKPFIIASGSGNAKLTSSSIPVLNRLILSSLVPIENIKGLLKSFEEAININVDIQLRTLQCLPSLVQKYDIEGENLLSLLGICSSLASNNKSPVVNNTASATLQQLFSNVYDKIQETQGDYDVVVDNDEILKVNKSSYEGYRILNDLCNIIRNEPLTFLKEEHIKQSSILEIIENIISNHRKLFDKHQELSYLLRHNLVPGLLNILNLPNQNFQLTTRSIRIIHVLLSTQLDNLEIENEIILSYLNHLLLNTDSNTITQDSSDQISWEKILVLEMFKTLFNDFNNIKGIYEKYDSNPKKKNVVQELMSIMSTFLTNNSYLLNDTVRFPSSNINTVSNKTSSMKVSILDHLDKSEPPNNIPNTYSIYLTLKILISYAEGTALFVSELSSDPETLELNVDFITSLIESCYPDVLVLFQNFIYFSMDNESFHNLIRSLQKFIHTAGLLGLSNLRDGLLTMLSDAIINNVSKTDIKRSAQGGNSLQEQGKQLLAFGESLVESFSSTIQSPNSQSPSQFQSSNENGDTIISPTQSNLSLEQQQEVIRPRKFNSRQATCLRALINLAVSLGSTLQGSWKIIWITFQWVDYYLEGPDEFSGFYNNKIFTNMTDDMLPTLTNQDLNNLDISMKKFYESINEYPVDSFYELLTVMTELFSIENMKKKEICPFNKSFFLVKLIEVTKINSNKFLILDNKSWDLLIKFFIELGMDRQIFHNLRINIVKNFNDLIINITNEGFRLDDIDINQATSIKSLDALMVFLEKLFEIGIPQELILLSCETEMHLIILDTLHELIDKYDTYYQERWDVVFKILNTSFRNIKDKNDKKLMNKIGSLISSSFDTLKLILDEFLLSLPFNQLKILINTLYNFCSQTYDLNISFSSVSYFWLISDSIKSRIIEKDEKAIDYQTIKSEEELTKFIDNFEESRNFYRVLNIYLLCTLAKILMDSRSQVRDGAIQTFFKIIDVHGNLIPSWELIYEIVLPLLLDLKNLQNASNKKDWIDSLSLILSGLVSIYGKFMMNFEEDKEGLSTEIGLKLWRRIIRFFENLLDLGWNDLNLKIFKSYYDLINSFQKIDKVNGEIRNLFYNFWINIPIEYDFINIQYQDTLSVLMDCFKPLYHIIESDLSIEETNKIINVLNKCARYPILPKNMKDENKPTNLQKSVMSNLELMLMNSKEEKILGLTIQQLTVILIYPFETRIRIEKKLSSKLNGDKIKIPSFIAISHISMDLIEKKLNDMKVQLLIEDKVIYKLLSSLLEIIENKAEGIKNRETKLWVDSYKFFQLLVTRLINENFELIEDKEEIWRYFLQGIMLSFNQEVDEEAETINIDQYNRIIKQVMPALLRRNNNEQILTSFIEKLYEKSFLYQLDDIEESIIENNIDDLVLIMTQYNFDDTFGTLTVLTPFSNQDTRIMCLQQLMTFVLNEDLTLLSEISLAYFINRVAYTLRRFISDSKLLYRAPLPKIQEQEILLIMQGLTRIEPRYSTNKNLQKLKSLLIKSIEFTDKIPQLTLLVETALRLQNI